MRLHAHEWGHPSRPPIVCLHGVIGHGGRFRKLAEERLASRYRVVALDLRGHGRSDFEPPWDLPAHLDDVAETVGGLGIESAAWIGHSFGGRLVMELTARSPERVERAVLIDPAIWVPPQVALQRAEAERVERSFQDADQAIAERIAAGLHHTPRELLEADVAEHLVRGDDGLLRYRYAQSAVVAAYGELAKPPPPFEALRVPTLLVRGELTDVVPDVLVEVYAEGLGDLLEVATVPGGHNPLWDAFAESAEAIDAFLA